MLVHSCIFRGKLIIHKGIRCHGDNGYCFSIGPREGTDPFGRGQAVHDRHANIHENSIVVINRAFIKFLNTLQPILDTIWLKANLRE